MNGKYVIKQKVLLTAQKYLDYDYDEFVDGAVSLKKSLIEAQMQYNK